MLSCLCTLFIARMTLDTAYQYILTLNTRCVLFPIRSLRINNIILNNNIAHFLRFPRWPKLNSRRVPVNITIIYSYGLKTFLFLYNTILNIFVEIFST